MRCSSEYSSIEPWPFESTKRSRPGQRGLAGLWRRCRPQSATAISAMPIGAPGWPELACWTASIDRARMALAISADRAAFVACVAVPRARPTLRRADYPG